MKLTFETIQSLNEEINSLYSDVNFTKTKLGYAVKRVYNSSLKKIFQEFNDELEDARIDNALTDEKTKEIMYDATGKYKYSKDGLKAMIARSKEIIAAWDVKEFDIAPYFVQELPELTQAQAEAFKGIFTE